MDPIDHLISEQRRIYEYRKYLIFNKQCLCFHGHLNPTKARKGKYISETLYNNMKKILRKDWYRKRLLGLHSSDDYPELNIYEISESNIKCEKCTQQLLNDMKKRICY